MAMKPVLTKFPSSKNKKKSFPSYRHHPEWKSPKAGSAHLSGNEFSPPNLMMLIELKMKQQQNKNEKPSNRTMRRPEGFDFGAEWVPFSDLEVLREFGLGLGLSKGFHVFPRCTFSATFRNNAVSMALQLGIDCCWASKMLRLMEHNRSGR